MKRWLWLASFLLAATAAHSQTVVQDSASFRGLKHWAPIMLVYPQDGTARAAEADAEGNLKISDGTPDRNQSWVYFDALNSGDKYIFKFGADSTAILDTQGANHIKVWFHAACTGAGTAGNCDSLGFYLFALQVRAHLTSMADSSTSHPWTLWRTVSVLVGPDSIGSFSRSSVATDSTADVVTEFLVPVRVHTETRVEPLGYWFHLRDPHTGEWFTAPKMSIRIRLLKVYNRDGAVTGGNQNSARYRMHVAGSR